MTEHTTLPYRINSRASTNVEDMNGRSIASCAGYQKDDQSFLENQANAEFIVQACNSHHNLLKACDRTLAVIYDMRPSDKCQLENNAQLLLEQAIAKATGKE